VRPRRGVEIRSTVRVLQQKRAVMRRSRFAAVAVALVLLAAACGGDGGSGTSSETTVEAGTAAGTGDPARIEAYFVEVSNILAEAANTTESCEEDVFNTPDLTEEELFQQGFGCVIGTFDSTTRSLAELVVPQGLEPSHEAYVASRQAWSEVATPLVEQLVSFEDAAAIFEDPEFIRTNDALAGSCEVLESEASGAGFSVSMDCEGPVPSEDLGGPPVGEVTATIDSRGWIIEPAGMIDTGGGVLLTITNGDDRTRQPVVADLFDGDPSQLPLRDGAVDLRQAGVVSDPDADPEVAHFGLAWPEPDGDDSRETAPDLAPGDSILVQLLPGNYVILDHLDGAYEAGEFATLVVVSLSDIQATYTEPPRAAQTCDELAEVIVGLYDAYTDEVALMTADGFEESPLSMIDDLRFGAVLQRSQQLGCSNEESIGEELGAAATAQFCQASPPTGSAAAVIFENVCGADG